MAVAFDTVDFNKYCAQDDYYEFGLSGVPVIYYRCIRCSFVFTEFCDSWTSTEFARHIYNDDYIKVDGEYAVTRPERAAEEFARRMQLCHDVRILDYGSGAGVFVDRLRDAGFRAIEAYDPFSSPKRPSGEFEIITCFEVIEHSPNPRQTFEDMSSLLADGGFIVFSQTVQPPNLSTIRGSWWYLAPRNGHVSTYSEESLFILARRLGMTMHRSGDLYAFVRGHLRHEVREALHTVGPPFWTTRIFAPAEVAVNEPAWGLPHATSSIQPDAWQGTEQEQIWSYRWTAAHTLSWLVRWDIAGEIQFRIPYRREVRPGFAAASRVLLNGSDGRMLVERGDIVAEFNVSRGGHGSLELHTPPPEVAGGPDQRMVGLAILTGFPPPSDGGGIMPQQATHWPRRVLRLLGV